MPNQLKNAAAPRRRLSRRHAPSTASGGSSRIRLSAWVCGAAANSNPTAANHNTVGPPQLSLKKRRRLKVHNASGQAGKANHSRFFK